jgi:opacity protein-like surface antigen
MVGVRTLLAAGAAALICSAASAADMPIPQVPQIPMQPIPLIVQQPLGGWYLRGDIGVGVQSFSEFNFTQTNLTFVWPSSWMIVQKDIQDTTIFGLGVGYEFNSWLRFDVTGEYRTRAEVKATGSYTNFCAGGGTCFDVNTANYSAAVFLANIYVDLGTWWCLTPFVGFGVGGAYNTISGMQDNGINSDGTNGFGFAASDNSSFSLAWDVTLGLSYSVNNNLKIDFSWRYLNLGSPQSPIVQCQNTTSCPSAFYTFKDMTSQDFRIGLRWMLQADSAPAVFAPQPMFAPQPVYAPQQIYAPQPVYTPQPLYTPSPQFMPQPQYVPVPQPQYMPAQPPLQSRG